MIGFNKKIMRV